MWELDYEESWAPKNWCFWTVVLDKTLESPLDREEIQPVHPKGHQSWVFIGRTDVEAEIPIVWPPDAKNWLIWKDPDAGKDWRQEKGITEDEMVGWHHWFNGHEFGQTLGASDGQGGLACCSPWDQKESECLSWTELEHSLALLLFGIRRKTDFIPVLWPLLSFPNLLTYWVQHFHSIIFRTWNSSAGILSPPVALFIVMFPMAHLTSHWRCLALDEWWVAVSNLIPRFE